MSRRTPRTAGVAIAAVGVELDHKVADLLEFLDAPVPQQLRSG